MSSIEGYGAPIIDIMHWWVNSPMTNVVGTMRNFVPNSRLALDGTMERMNIDDGDLWICEFADPVVASIQSSYVTVGNYPGIEARIYGSEGAIIVRLVEELGSVRPSRRRPKTKSSSSNERFLSRTSPRAALVATWPSLLYSNLIRNFTDEILGDVPETQGDFAQGAIVQRTINAFERSFRERRWVNFSEVPGA